MVKESVPVLQQDLRLLFNNDMSSSSTVSDLFNNNSTRVITTTTVSTFFQLSRCCHIYKSVVVDTIVR